MTTLSNLVRNAMDRCRISRQDPFVAGFSGGRDSVCLVHLLNKLGYTGMQAVYVHHGLRGEADGEAEWTHRFCDEYGIGYRCVRIDTQTFAKEKGMSTEEAARTLRYQALADAAGENGVIVTAHHAEDQAETVLLHLMRGSGLTGMTGMRECAAYGTDAVAAGEPDAGSQAAGNQAACRIIRPLLQADRGQIEEYLRENDLSWQEDASNQDTGYTRNWIRHRLLPLMREQNPAITAVLCRTAELLQTDEDFLREKTERAYQTARDSGAIRTEALRGLPEAIQRRVLRFFVEETCGLHDVAEVHIRQLEALCEAETGTETMFPGGIVFRKEYGKILVLDDKLSGQTDTLFETDSGAAEMELIADGNWHPADAYEYRAEYVDPGAFSPGQIPDMPYTKWLNCDKLKNQLMIRTRRPGDRIALQGGHKKLQDVLVDAKIPERERDRILLVADGRDILWIVGGRISADSYVRPDTVRILQMECRERQEEVLKN